MTTRSSFLVVMGDQMTASALGCHGGPAGRSRSLDAPAGFSHAHDPCVTRQRHRDLYEDVEVPLPAGAAPCGG